MVGALLIIAASAATMTAAMTFESKIDGIIMDKKAALKKVDNEEGEAAEGEEAVVEASDADVVEVKDVASNVVEFTSDAEGNLKKDGNEVQTSFQPQPDQQPQQPDLDAIKVINFTDNRSSQN